MGEYELRLKPGDIGHVRDSPAGLRVGAKCFSTKTAWKRIHYHRLVSVDSPRPPNLEPCTTEPAGDIHGLGEAGSRSRLSTER